jgi:flagellar biosynthesis/type III secretory pathway protein FliH
LLRDTRDAESFIEHIRAWASELQQLDPGGQEAHVIVNYVLRISGDVPAETIRKHIVEVAPALEKPMASAAEQLIQQGLQRGLEQGREEGLEKGLEQGQQQGRAAALRHTLERLLQLRFGPLDDDSRARVASAPVDELERFIERVISAGQLDEVFGG